MTEVIFFVFAALALAGALGVVLARNPVHSALFLVVTLVSVAVFFIQQQAQLLAVVQIVVYAGAIVVLFLFVIMLLGVDREESLRDPIPFQRPAAIALGVIVLGEIAVPRRSRVGHGQARRLPPQHQGRCHRSRRQRGAGGAGAVHRLPLALRDHVGPARDRRRRRRAARPPERPAHRGARADSPSRRPSEPRVRPRQ